MVTRLFSIALACIVLAAFAASTPLEAQTAVEATSASPLGNKEPWKAETAIGDLVADAFRYAAKTDVAFVAASELKTADQPLPAGKVSSSDITALFSYPNDSLAVLALTGSNIRQALEKSVALYPQTNQGFLQVSGLSFTFDPTKPAGQRVQTITVGGRAIENDRTYTVTTTSSLAQGALGYWKIWSKNAIQKKLTDRSAVNAVVGYLQANPRIDYGKLDRIRATR